MNTDLIAYYKKRAQEYEHIYLKAERQPDIQQTTVILQNIFKDQSVYEVACGTGFWTEKIALTARRITATDINDEVLEVARQKKYPNSNVVYSNADLFKLKMQKEYDHLFAGFIWSHIKVAELQTFLTALHQLLVPGAKVVFMDNLYVEGSNHPVTRTDASGNTYQTRQLLDGTSHEVLKNFPTEKFLKQTIDHLAVNIEFIQLKYFWILSYELK